MSAKLAISAEPIFYPETDGKPMAENTLQYDWITMIVGSLREIHLKRDDVFIAGDLFWYPVEGSTTIVQAPDAMVVMGRPKGFRMSYKQWEEEDVAPQVVFEVLSPGNTDEQMGEKRSFYERYGVEEYYVIDPFVNEVEGWQRRGNSLKRIAKMNGWVSPRLGIRFETGGDEITLRSPEGRSFVFYEHRILEFMEEIARREREMRELAAQSERNLQLQLAEAERQLQAERAEAERQLQAERILLDRERKEKEALAAMLRELGVDPNARK